MMQAGSSTQGYGRLLQSARDAAGLTTVDIAEKLNLDLCLVEALEKENHKALPAPAFVRGYIRSYAQLVKCDPEAVLQQYNQQQHDEPELSHYEPVEAYQQPTRSIGVWGIVLVALIALGLAAFWLTGARETMQTAFDNAVQPETELAFEQETEMGLLGLQEDEIAGEMSLLPGLQQEQNISGLEQSGFISEESVELTEQSVLGEESAASESSDAEPEFDISAMPDRQDVVLEAPYGEDRLGLDFAGDCWVEVVDANGFRLLFGLFGQSDGELTVTGQAPFQVILGNAHLVSVSVNGNSFELKRYIRSNNTARILLTAEARLFRE